MPANSVDAGGSCKKYSNAGHQQIITNQYHIHQAQKEKNRLYRRESSAVLLACPRTNRPRRGHLPVVAGVTNHHCYRGQDFKVFARQLQLVKYLP